jgi:hypothetical protein
VIYCGGISIGNATYYFSTYGNTQSGSNTETLIQEPILSNCTLTEMSVYLDGTQPAGTLVFYFRRNAVNYASLGVPGNSVPGVYSVTANAVCNAGDMWAVMVQNLATTPSPPWNLMLCFK